MKNDLVGQIGMATAHVMGLAGLLNDGDQIKGLFGKFDPIEPREPVDPAVIEETRRKMSALCTNPGTRPEMVAGFSSTIIVIAFATVREVALKAGIHDIDTGDKLVDMIVATCERGDKFRMIEAINEGAGEAAVELCTLLVENYTRTELLEIVTSSENIIFRTNLR